MIVRRSPPLHLAYCLNVHRGEDWAANLEAIRTHTLDIRERVAPGDTFGLGLRLSRRAADELCDPARLADFRRFMAEHGLYVFTINGFPYGGFHDVPVKKSVYAPDWRSPERLEYTRRLGDILAGLLPEGTPGSISTVPGSYRDWMQSEADTEELVGNLADCVSHLGRIEAETGRHITLALEPEPDCLLDTTAGTVEFFNTVLARHPAMHAAGEKWRSYLGVCLDACHLSVQFEEPATGLSMLLQNGIQVPKVHLSAALRAPCSRETASRLSAFADETYLHQTRIRLADGRILCWPDLTKEALETVAREPDAEARVHVHVPLYFEQSQGLCSTATDLSPKFFRTATDAGVPHLEIETYTFDVLPPALASLPVEESTAREYRWVLDRL